MSWEKVKVSSFLTPREERFKPNAEEIKGLRRIEKINFSGEIFISEKPSKTDMILIKKNDLVISGINVSKGAVAVYEDKEDITATIHYSSYTYNEDIIDIEFLKIFLKSPEFLEALKEQVPGGIKTEIKPKHLLPLEVIIPNDVKIQRTIVDKYISQELKKNKLSKEIDEQQTYLTKLRQAFLAEAMQGKLVPQSAAADNDEPASELLKKIKAEKEKLIKEKKIKKQKPLPAIKPEEIPYEIPENWVWVRLGEIAQNYDDRRKPVSLKEREHRSKTYDYYGASGIIDKIDYYTHDGNFLLIGEDGANLKMRSTPVAFIARGKFWVNNHAHVIGFKNDIILQFIEYAINSLSLDQYLTGGFQPKLSQASLNNIIIGLPPLAEQRRIVEKLDKLMQKCDELEASINTTKEQTEQLIEVLLKEALTAEE